MHFNFALEQYIMNVWGFGGRNSVMWCLFQHAELSLLERLLFDSVELQDFQGQRLSYSLQPRFVSVCLFGWLFFGDSIVELLIQTIVEMVVFHVVNFQLAIRILSVWCYVHALVLTHNTVVSDYCIAVPNKFLTHLVNKRNFYSFGRYLKSSALCQFR